MDKITQEHDILIQPNEESFLYFNYSKINGEIFRNSLASSKIEFCFSNLQIQFKIVEN